MRLAIDVGTWAVKPERRITESAEDVTLMLSVRSAHGLRHG